METRKIQGIGGSSFSVTLPKKWVSANKLKDKSEVVMMEQKSGALQVLPLRKTKMERKAVSIEGIVGDELYRELIVLYILGFEEIELYADPVTLEQRKTVRRVSQKLAGMETMEESSKTIFLRSFIDPEKFSFTEYLEKVFLMTRLMFSDSITAFVRHNTDLAADVAERDFEIDKIDFLISRMKHSLMSNKISEEKLKTGIILADYYESITKQLERIADHAVKIAKLAESDPFPSNQKLDHILISGSEKVTALLKQVEEFTLKTDKKLANKVLNDIFKEPPYASGLYGEMMKIGYAPGLVLSDSLDRISGYIVNMAEYTLTQASAD